MANKTDINSYLEQKEYKQAEVLLQNYCTEHPADPESFYMLGQTLAQLGRFSDAEVAFRRVIDIQPGVAVSYGSLGSIFRESGRFVEAVEVLQKACEILPEDEGYRLLLIECLEQAGRRQDAFQECYKLLEKNSESGRGYFILATLCFCAQQYSHAIENYLLAVEHLPDLIDAHVGLGKVYTTIGKLEQAQSHYDLVLEQRPDHIESIAGLALLHERSGEMDDAYQKVRRIVDMGCQHTTVANVYANICDRFNDCVKAVQYAEAALNLLAKDAQFERKVLHFTLGRRYDKLGDYDKAFEHFKQANGQFHVNYDPAAHTDLVTSIIQTFSPAYMMGAPRASIQSARPVFIVGMPRSGTSLVEQVISSHPEVAAAGELEDISDMISKTSGIIGTRGGYPLGVPKLTNAQLDVLAGAYHSHLQEISPGTKHITDKMPHNFMALGLIAQLFPGARVVHCTRDPLDTCLSIYFQDFTRHHDYAVNLESIGTHYRQYQRLMSHWHNVLGLPMIEMEYQKMIHDQEATTRNLLDFCELEWDAVCLNFHNSKRVVHTASYSQVTQPIYRQSVERWRHYERYLDDLKIALMRDY